jgi:hypothetical protein
MTLLSLLRKYAGMPDLDSEPLFLTDQDLGDTVEFIQHWASAIKDEGLLEAFLERVAILEIDGELEPGKAVNLALQLCEIDPEKEK